jgi:hypothetical protein
LEPLAVAASLGDRVMPQADRSEKDGQMSAAQGMTAYGAENGVRTDQVRRHYNKSASRLDPNDSGGRTALKKRTRVLTPAPQRAVIGSMKPDTGPQPGSIGGARRTNRGWSEAAKHMGRAGRVLGGLGLALDAWDIAHAHNKLRAVAGVAGSNALGIGGGIGGAELGGELGLLGGPFAEITVPAGAIIGGLLGSAFGGTQGHRIGTKIYDRTAGHGQD